MVSKKILVIVKHTYTTYTVLQWKWSVGESHGSHHDHEVAVIGGTAEQVWGHTRETALGEGTGRGLNKW